MWCDERRPANVNIAAAVILKLNLRVVGEAAARQKPTLAGWWQRQRHYLLKSSGAETAIRAITCAIGDTMSPAQSTTEEAVLI